MTKILFFVLIYLIYLFIWFIISLLAYFVSLVLKKRAIVEGVAAISIVVIYILNLFIGLFLLWWAISVLLNGQLLWFLFLIFFGIGLISGLISYLQMPFIFIPTYFSEKIENLNFEEDIASAEILDKDNKVVGKIEGDTTISIRLAKYFLGVYFMGLAYILVFPEERSGLSWWSYIGKPFIQVVYLTFFIGLLYLIYRKIRYKSYFPDDKRYFFIQVWKFSLYIFIPFGILLLALAIMTNTL